MTDRLYYSDCYTCEFDARVVRAERIDGRELVLLDRTAFYPASGGQPFDTGRLGGVRVVDVVDDETRGILHVVDGQLRQGESVHGSVDWERRFDHMQQHTGQHLLSAALDLPGARTESFHLGALSSTIDLARAVTPDEIARAEKDANRVVWENRPVAIRFADASEAAKLPLRKEPLRGGTLRLIEIEDYDISACGGTHVARTGAIGMIAVVASEKFRGGTRIEFVCGGRALAGYRAFRETSAACVRLLSVHPSELPSAIERLQADVKASNRTLRGLQSELARYFADRLAESASGSRIVVEALPDWDQHGLKILASAITERSGYSAALFGASTPSPVVVARAADASIDAAAVLRKLIERFGGKGGGRPELAQGGGLSGDPQTMADFARELLRHP